MQTDAARSQLAHILEEARPAREAVISQEPLAAENLPPQVPRLLHLVANSSLSSRSVSGGKLQPQTVSTGGRDKQAASCEGVWCR